MVVYLELSVQLLFREQKGKKSQLVSAYDMKLHSEEIYAAVVTVYNQGPNNAQRLFASP